MQILQDFSKTKILVVGDVMLDRYWWGDVKRISPEAPVPVIELNNCTYSAGGAANVAVNVAGLGATPMLIGVVGSDPEAAFLREELDRSGVASEHLESISTRPTTVKTRVVAHSQQVARVDHEVNAPLDEHSERAMHAKLEALIANADAIILSDYAKGVLTDWLLVEIITMAAAAGKTVLVDPKGKDYDKYRGAHIITPNRIEAAEACNLDAGRLDLVEIAGDQLIRRLNIDSVLITQGEAGMTLFQRGKNMRHFPAAARNVYDVTGAGDTVIATLATAIGAGADLETATKLANAAAGIVVESMGTSSISASQLLQAVD